ncbi:hypothetical protein BPAE_0154g00300 [Botrytis paeoniae]|uniref:Uncharacterized protein n=1 Tax=Botrytis paeoniae TaxID=278948 RepID=A0A4Z1FHU3_9HELO|nr:hypothetical protein BPAE_0154g00300 [Botrytis paeoniae]
MLEIIESDRRIPFEEVKICRANCTATVKHNPIYANFHRKVKHYYVEQSMWLKLCELIILNETSDKDTNNFLVQGYPFPGIKPKPIEHAVTRPVARTATGRSSESTGGDKASKAASAAKGRHLNNTAKVDSRLASRSNTSTTGHSSAQEKVNTPQAQSFTIPPPSKIMRNREDVGSQQGCSQGAENLSPRPSAPAGSHPTSGRIPCPDAAAHRPSIELSAGKRKRTISDLDALPQSETANRPRYGISVPASPTVAEMLMSRKAAVEKHFGVRFEYGLHKEELKFYCEPVDIGSMTYNDAVELCEPAFKFLKEFLHNSFG